MTLLSFIAIIMTYLALTLTANLAFLWADWKDRREERRERERRERRRTGT
jgi:hypothetical protein